jgi:hypothetical protein
MAKRGPLNLDCGCRQQAIAGELCTSPGRDAGFVLGRGVRNTFSRQGFVCPGGRYAIPVLLVVEILRFHL